MCQKRRRRQTWARQLVLLDSPTFISSSILFTQARLGSMPETQDLLVHSGYFDTQMQAALASLPYRNKIMDMELRNATPTPVQIQPAHSISHLPFAISTFNLSFYLPLHPSTSTKLTMPSTALLQSDTLYITLETGGIPGTFVSSIPFNKCTMEYSHTYHPKHWGIFITTSAPQGVYYHATTKFGGYQLEANPSLACNWFFYLRLAQF